MNGAELIAAERERQVTHEGWSLEHDDSHSDGEIAKAAACYCLTSDEVVMQDEQVNSSRGAGDCYTYDFRPINPGPGQIQWPWHADWYKPTTDRVRQLVKAGALIAAEIDRLQRAAEAREPAHE